MKEEVPKERFQTHGCLTLMMSMLLILVGYTIDQTFRWTSHLSGFVSGLMQGVIISLCLCIYLVPWNLLVIGLYRWRKWRRFRTRILLLPAALFFLLNIVSLVVWPPTANGLFRQLLISPIPEGIEVHEGYREGGGFADYTYVMHFSLTPETVPALLGCYSFETSRTDRVSLESFFLRRRGTNDLKASSFRDRLGSGDWPDPTAWGEVEIYRAHSSNQIWSFELLLNTNHTKAYFMAGCI